MGAQVSVAVDRRTLIAGAVAAAGSVLAVPAIGRGVRPLVPEMQLLTITPARATRMVAWVPARPRGVALLSTGHGSWPERYDALAQRLGAEGFAVFAPLHVDSVRHPDRAAFTMQASFGERIADLNAAVAQAGRAYPGLPIIAVGHSFGTLSALCLAGGLGYVAPFRNPAVRAVLGFSSPGRVPGLVQPTAYAGVATPVMIVTGTADTVPGFVTDPADHLLAAETAPGPAYALVLDGGAHELVAGTDPRFARAIVPALAFADAYGLDDAAARTRLARWQPASGDRLIVRNAA